MILLDTSVLVAIVDQRDPQRPKALKDLTQLARRGLLLSWPVLTEALHFLVRPDYRDYLAHFIDDFQIRFADEQVRPATADIFHWLARYADHAPDMTDAYLVAMTAMNRRWKVWTFDREFHFVWRRPDGSPVPMAVKM